MRHGHGAPWRDRNHSTWLDGFNDSVWVYAARLAAEAVRVGFADVQFDYVRFPDAVEPGIAEAVFPIAATGNFGRLEGLRFLQMVQKKVYWLTHNAQKLIEKARWLAKY